MLIPLFLSVLNASLAALPLMLALLLLRAAFKKRLPRRLFYAAWALVLLRLLIPFSLPSGFSFYNLFPAESVTQSEHATAVVLVEDSRERWISPFWRCRGRKPPNRSLPPRRPIPRRRPPRR